MATPAAMFQTWAAIPGSVEERLVTWTASVERSIGAMSRRSWALAGVLALSLTACSDDEELDWSPTEEQEPPEESRPPRGERRGQRREFEGIEMRCQRLRKTLGRNI